MILKKRKAAKMGVREETKVRSHRHLTHVRSFVCCAFGRSGHECDGRMEAHHVREETDGGVGMKPSDEFTVPLCSVAHMELHSKGEATFQAKYGVDLLAIAARLWRTSPARVTK